MPRWTDREEEVLKEKYTVLSWDELKRLFGRSKDSIEHHARKRGLSRMRFGCVDEEFLKMLESREL